MNDFNQQVIEEFRANQGQAGGPFEGTLAVFRRRPNRSEPPHLERVIDWT